MDPTLTEEWHFQHQEPAYSLVSFGNNTSPGIGTAESILKQAINKTSAELLKPITRSCKFFSSITFEEAEGG